MNAALVALAGAATMAGLVLILAAWTSTDLLPARPAGRPRRGIVRLRSRRSLAGTIGVVAASIAAWAVTGWPVAGLATAAAVVFLPRLFGGRNIQRRIARLEAMETWTRQLAAIGPGNPSIAATPARPRRHRPQAPCTETRSQHR